MIVTIAKRFTFDAAHRIDTFPQDHKCHRLHGHTYAVELILRGNPSTFTGIVVDYAEIAAAWAPLHELLDHRYLNQVPGLEIPTTENLAVWIVERIAGAACLAVSSPYPFSKLEDATLLWCVRVAESESTWCEALVKDVHADKPEVPRPWAELAELASGKSSLEQHLADDQARIKFVSIEHGRPCSCTVELDADRSVNLGPNCAFVMVVNDG